MGEFMNAKDIPEGIAREMLSVGIAPSEEGPDQEPIGHRFFLNKQPVVVSGYATREQFLAAVEKAGLPVEEFSACPAGMYFQILTTD